MKTVIACVLGVIVLAFGATIVLRREKPVQPSPEVQEMQARLAEKDRQIEQLQSEQQKAAEQAREVARLSDDIAAQARSRELALSNTVAEKAAALMKDAGADGSGEKGGFGKAFAGMFKDPEMKSFLLEQQRANMERLYGPLTKRLNLTPEETKAFNDVLAGQMERGMDAAASMFGGDGSTNRTEMMQAMKVEQLATEQKMKELLGEDRYAQYQDYQQTVGERALLTAFRQQNTGEEQITDDQAEKLLALMGEEKKKVAADTNMQFPDQDPSNMEAVFKEGQLEKLLQSQETVNQNVYARAAEVLSPSQLDSFAKYQTNQLQTMRMGLTMARKMMGGETKSAQ